MLYQWKTTDRELNRHAFPSAGHPWLPVSYIE